MVHVWLAFPPPQHEQFRVEVGESAVVEDIKKELLKEPFIHKFGLPTPEATLDIQLLQDSKPLSPTTPIALLQETATNPLRIINNTQSIEEVTASVAKVNLEHTPTGKRIPHMKFTVNGAINSTEGLFFVRPDNSVLVKYIHESAYIMLTGHRGSGKSSRCWHSINNELPEYDTLCTTFQGILADTPKIFWKSYGAQIKRHCKGTRLYWDGDITNKDSFLEFFSFHCGKQIVLFMDEFDLLLSHQKVLEQLYDALRFMKDKRISQYGLQSLIAIGPYSIRQYSKQELSPFNASDHWEAPYFTRDQVECLFENFQSTCGVELESGVVDCIYEVTMGHPGMVCFCGKMIQEKLLLTASSLSLATWMQYETFELRQDICSDWRTVKALSTKVQEEKYADFLIKNALSTIESMPYDDSNIIQLDLIGLGALAKRGNDVEVSSPLVRAILLKSVTYTPQVTPELLPITTYGLLDVPALMNNICRFDALHMRNALIVSSKQNRTTAADAKRNQVVPHEGVYALELHRFLALILPPAFTKEGGMNGPRSSRPDIVVSNRLKERVVIELAAHVPDGPETDDGTVLGHILRCHQKYSIIEGTKETWMVNFTTRRPNKEKDGYGYVWSEYNDVKVLHIWHDLGWTTAQITQEDPKQKHKYMMTDLIL